MTALLGFIFDNVIGKTLVAVVAAAALFAGWLWRHEARVAERVENKIITQSKEAGKVAHAKARKAHAAARQPGAAERVLSKYCADCN
jgi:hypothetical protein